MNAISLAFLSVGGWQVVLILVVVLILFGGRKMPELARGLGQSIKEFKRATRDAQDEIHRAIDDDLHHQQYQQSQTSQSSASAASAKGAPSAASGTPVAGTGATTPAQDVRKA
ncbi:MAG: twin-arginine translocase TatA/TatE family subunit [Verrucomicrobia bacterium]|nr:twin-arginine translocase TatA/TatE family subunit [Verrucomicrobiota bacterium]